MNRDQKAAVIDEVAGQIRESATIFAVDYRGLSVTQAGELRVRLADADASFRVVKNRLTKLAADQAGVESLKDLLEGPTAFTFVRGDAALAAKAIAQIAREHDVLAFKGGVMDGEQLTGDQIGEIAKLPGRDALEAQLVGVIASPLATLVRGLGSMVSGLAVALGQIRDQGLVAGETPAEEPVEAPAEDVPAAEAAAEESATEAPAEENEASEEPADEPVAETDEPDADTFKRD